MKKTFFALLCIFHLTGIQAQEMVTDQTLEGGNAENICQEVAADSTFIGRWENEELKIFMVLNLVEKNIEVPGQEVFGEMDGYIGSTETTHVWAIVSSQVEGKTATLDVINNYGSEDLQATFTREKDGSYTWKHQEGSTLKFPVDRKWYKIPGKVTFKKNVAK